MKPVFLPFCFLTTAFLTVACSPNPPSPSSISEVHIYPGEEIVSTISTHRTYEVTNCGIDEPSTQTVSYSVSFDVDYDLLNGSGNGSQIDLRTIELDISFAQDAVSKYLSTVPEVTISSGSTSGTLTVSRELSVQPNERRTYEVVWEEQWAVGLIGVPIDDISEEAANAMLEINKFIDNVGGDYINTEQSQQDWQSEIERLQEREYLIPFRMPLNLNITDISVTTEGC